MIVVPSKISWEVDLKKSNEELFSSKVIQRLKLSVYNERIRINIASPDLIEEIFLPLYERLLMSRDTFRLDKEVTRANIQRMSKNSEYKLLLVRHVNGEILGGIVFKLLPNLAKICYRAFDHGAALANNMEQLDYFTEVYLNNYFRKMGVFILSHGTDIHPVTQVGLSIFKLRSGARPKVSERAVELVYNEDGWQKFLEVNKICGYYSDPDPEFFTKFHLFGDSQSDLVKSFVKVAERSGIEIVTE